MLTEKTKPNLPEAYFSKGDEPAPLSLGCWIFGGKDWGGQEDDTSRAVLKASLEAGLTHWDSAKGYGNGHSESLCGEFLQKNRDKVFIASKAGTQKDPEKIIRSLDSSLQLLKTDCIDLFYVHWPKTGVDLRPQMELLEKARSQGKIRFIGVSNHSIEQMDQCREAGTIDAHQANYSLYWRNPEAELIPYCQKHNIALVTYSSIAQGILTGKFTTKPEFGNDDVRSRVYFFEDNVWPHLYEATEELKRLAEKAGQPLINLAIQWVQRQPGVSSVIVGARNTEQLASNLGALKTPVSSEIIDEMTAISDAALAKLPPDSGNIFGYHP